jgi:hypothetical protein
MMSNAPIKKCDYCETVGEMPTFMDGETCCFVCLKKPYRKWERKHVDAYLLERDLVAVPDRMIEFLLGECDLNLDDYWFGDKKEGASFWWRKELREIYNKAMIAAQGEE